MWSTRFCTGSQKNNVRLSENGQKIASIMKVYCVKHLMIERLTPLHTQSHLTLTSALLRQLCMRLKKHRVKATTPEWLMYFWSEMQCPAVNLMIFYPKAPLKGESYSTCNPTCFAQSRESAWLACGGQVLILGAGCVLPYPEAMALHVSSLLCRAPLLPIT